MPRLSRITVFPIKALGGCDVAKARVLPSGALEHDRRFAIVDGQGRFIQGKRTPAVHVIRAVFDESLTCVTLSGPRPAQSFQLSQDTNAIAMWLSDALQLKCRLIENPDGGFPDDNDAPGPTLISTASLAAAASWFDGIDEPEMRRRIRANLEIEAPEPFWEDRLADDGGSPRPFRIGPVEYRGRTICARCIVPTRDSLSGDGDAAFARTFAECRRSELPAWSPAEQFDHYYRLAINTSGEWVENGAALRIGDELVT